MGFSLQDFFIFDRVSLPMDQKGLLGETGWVSEIETPTNDE